MDSQEVIQKVHYHLTAHPNAALQVIAEELGITGQSIEQILREVEGHRLRSFGETCGWRKHSDCLKPVELLRVHPMKKPEPGSVLSFPGLP